MKIPSKNWPEKISEKMADYESPVPAGLFNNVIKKRQQRKWLAGIRRSSRYSWLLLLLFIPFTCHYFYHPLFTNSGSMVSGSDIASATGEPLPLKETNPVSPDKVSSFQPIASGNEKDPAPTNSIDRDKHSVVKSKSANHPPQISDVADDAASGGFRNTAKVAEKEKQTSAVQQHSPTAAHDLPSSSALPESISFNSGHPSRESDLNPLLPLYAASLFEATSTSETILSEKTAAVNAASAATTETSPASRNLQWSLEVLFSPDFSFQQLTDQPGDSLMLTDWNKHMQHAYTAGLRVSVHTDGGLFLKSGMLYSTQQSAFTLQKNWQVSIITDSTYYYTIWSPFKDPVNVFYSDTVISTIDSIASYQSSVKYAFWNIPMLIGYTFDLQKFQVSMQSGIICNVSFQQKGSGINPETLEPVTLPEKDASYYRYRAALSYYGGIETEYRFNDHIGIFGEPYLQMQLKTITGEDAPVAQQLYQFGFNTGIKFSF
ncbi:MAG: DUF2715 domain-containing protein [Chitinophagales bacterium]|nr:DUF2715 domain-containing protein [Chitinophagales bacterium]